MGQFVDRTGVRYGRLIALRVDVAAGPASNGRRLRWICACDCGGTKSVTGASLHRGETTSCGCAHRDIVGRLRRTHGMSRSATHNTWRAMIERCENPKSDAYAKYGAKGIAVCQRWRSSFASFLSDMGERPDGKTLDRINPTLGYFLENCRWATAKQQGANRRTTTTYDWNGERLLLREIAEREGIPATSLRKRMRVVRDINQAVALTRAMMKMAT